MSFRLSEAQNRLRTRGKKVSKEKTVYIFKNITGGISILRT